MRLRARAKGLYKQKDQSRGLHPRKNGLELCKFSSIHFVDMPKFKVRVIGNHRRIYFQIRVRILVMLAGSTRRTSRSEVYKRIHRLRHDSSTARRLWVSRHRK